MDGGRTRLPFRRRGRLAGECRGKSEVTLGGGSFKLAHFDGKLTCFPSHAGLVKVTRISADGWAKRELQSLWLYPDRGIVARFMDGTQARIATSAPARMSAILAA